MIQANYLTIDVEDYFQVSAFEDIVAIDDWDTYPSRVVQNTRKILSLLNTNDVKATFFVLGWVGEKHPELVKEISDNGHEIGCHGYYHRLVYNLTPDEFRQDTWRAKDTLEQITGVKVSGYRAPSYSITQKSLWSLDILVELGFDYDSSIFPVRHDRYGIPDAPRFPFSWDLSGETPQYHQLDVPPGNHLNNLVEYPISTAKIAGRNIPVSGGGYFRLFPYWFTRFALRKINKQEKKPFVFYLHPWEIDPKQPRFNTASAISRFRHYNNLTKTSDRFNSLLQEFSFTPLRHQPGPADLSI